MNTNPAPGIVIVDKPQGMTSHDVVQTCRHYFHTRKVGHAGTLDPLATGVLVIGIGRATKVLGLLGATTKSYHACIRLGQTTSTDDIEGTVLTQCRTDHLDPHTIMQASAAFVGSVMQVPSTVSALKVGGVRAYQLARQGNAPQLAPRPIHISRFDITAISPHRNYIDLDAHIDCSAGTYIRALARDLGAMLGVGGCLSALRRTAVGSMSIDHACSLEALREDPHLSYSLDHWCTTTFPQRLITPDQAEDLSHGRSLEAGQFSGAYAAVDSDGRTWAILRDGPERTEFLVVIRPAT